MANDKQRVPITDYCPTQKCEFTAYGNYINDGFGEYTLGTIYCPFKEQGHKCSENPCPFRSKLPKQKTLSH